MDRHPFVQNLRRHLLASDITLDAMFDATRDTDPDGYSRETLRAMENGSRRIQLRAMWAMAAAVGYPAGADPYYRLTVVKYLLDDDLHGPERALANLEALEITGPVSVDPEVIRAIPISHRRDALREAAKRSK